MVASGAEALDAVVVELCHVHLDCPFFRSTCNVARPKETTLASPQFTKRMVETKVLVKNLDTVVFTVTDIQITVWSNAKSVWTIELINLRALTSSGTNIGTILEGEAVNLVVEGVTHVQGVVPYANLIWRPLPQLKFCWDVEAIGGGDSGAVNLCDERLSGWGSGVTEHAFSHGLDTATVHDMVDDSNLTVQLFRRTFNKH
jgi:hypothetical protein